MFEEINNLYGLFVMNYNLPLFVLSLSFFYLGGRGVSSRGVYAPYEIWIVFFYPWWKALMWGIGGRRQNYSLFSYKIFIFPLVGPELFFLVEGVGTTFLAPFGRNSGPEENISHPTPKNRIYSWWEKNLYTPLEGELKKESTMIFSCIVW